MTASQFLGLTRPFVSTDPDDVQLWVDAVVMINVYVLKEFNRMVAGEAVSQ